MFILNKCIKCKNFVNYFRFDHEVIKVIAQKSFIFVAKKDNLLIVFNFDQINAFANQIDSLLFIFMNEDDIEIILKTNEMRYLFIIIQIFNQLHQIKCDSKKKFIKCFLFIKKSKNNSMHFEQSTYFAFVDFRNCNCIKIDYFYFFNS